MNLAIVFLDWGNETKLVTDFSSCFVLAFVKKTYRIKYLYEKTHELRVASYEIRYTRYEFKSTS